MGKERCPVFFRLARYNVETANSRSLATKVAHIDTSSTQGAEAGEQQVKG